MKDKMPSVAGLEAIGLVAIYNQYGGGAICAVFLLIVIFTLISAAAEKVDK